MPSITFQPVLRDVKDVLKSDYYEIPRFQRPYAWGPEHLDEFWTDVVADNDEGYFIGPMVSYKMRRDTFAIVDGQQRITTLTLILCAIRDRFVSCGRTDLADGVTKYIERTDDDNIAHFVLRSEPAGTFLSSQVQVRPAARMEVAPANEDQQNIRRAFTEINSRLSGDLGTVPDEGLADDHEFIIRLKAVRDRILGLQVIWIVLDSEDDAYVIFETLNSRGRDLEVADLLKNYILNRMPAENGDLDTPGILWRDMRATLANQGGDVNANTFILHWWLSRYKYVSERKLFRTMKLEKLGGLTASSAATSLLLDAQLYSRIANPDSWKSIHSEFAVRNSLIALNTFGVRQPRPFLLALFRAYSERRITFKRLRSTLRAIESYHFITTAVVGASSTGGQSQMYAAHAREVSKAITSDAAYKAIDELIGKLRGSVSQRETFITEFTTGLRFSETESKDKRLVQYVLRSLHDASRAPYAIDHSKCNIEHIAPQKIGRPWVGAIGNLIWIETGLNSQLGSADFRTKREILAPFAEAYGLGAILANEAWGASQVQARSRRLAEIAYDEVWTF
ncbi:DUF262 domain-containing HNH endonuclease family protein [uncultured Cellulomonas sp.]|uniref:DUF262 domain-containing protein n=1 Tax=uncultured Cellulomonas sp. TaxID=189682 RepID=UPI0028E72EE0|nr:DUF262 domain-containing HNH endonuclease family protein [uncultured Cellulomonas sp.]